jgi:hypothetical protein
LRTTRRKETSTTRSRPRRGPAVLASAGHRA